MTSYPPRAPQPSTIRPATTAATDIVFEIEFTDDTAEELHGANGYQQEGHMTTFFHTSSDRGVMDSWSTRIASFKTTELAKIRRQVRETPSREMARSTCAGRVGLRRGLHVPSLR